MGGKDNLANAASDELAGEAAQLHFDDSIQKRHEPAFGIVLAHLAVEERTLG